MVRHTGEYACVTVCVSVPRRMRVSVRALVYVYVCVCACNSVNVCCLEKWAIKSNTVIIIDIFCLCCKTIFELVGQ